MRKILLATVALIFQTAHGISLHQREIPAVVGFNFERRKIRDRPLHKRDSAISSTLYTEDDIAGYLVNLTVGTPPQKVQVLVDTGSSDTWVNIPTSYFCEDYRNDCAEYGTYNSTASSTYKLVNHNFNITYIDNSGAVGDYVQDTVGFGGASLEKFQFGVATESNTNEGTLGIGYPALEGTTTTYPNFPQALMQAGYTKSPAYSLWLDDVTSQTGTILFGGVNTAKYLGELQTLPLSPSANDTYTTLQVILTGLSLQTDSSKVINFPSKEFALLVTLDTGTSLTYLPEALTAQIYNDLGVELDEGLGVGVIPCSMRDESYALIFDISGVKINVNITELVLDEIATNGYESICAFGIYPSSEYLVVLGDTFLRSVYVVFDLANNEVSMANANFNATKDNILEIGTGSDAVPNATLVKNPATKYINAAVASQVDLKLLVAELVGAAVLFAAF